LLADALGRVDEAVDHFTRAVETNDRIGAVPWSVRSRVELARVIEASSPDRAKALRHDALTAAEAHGLVTMQRHALSAL
jgi:hypothetical protein